MEISRAQRGALLRRLGFQQTSESEMVLVPPLRPASTTLVLFDWDDTLFPTTALNQSTLLVPISSRDKVQLALAVKAILRSALNLGRTIIITNASTSWVQHTYRHLIPALAESIRGVPIVSARELYEGRFPHDPVMWKCEAFAALKENSGQIANLVAIGDSEAEMRAITALAKLYHTSFTKTVRFRSTPSVAELIKQVELLDAKLPAIVHRAQNLKISMVRCHSTQLRQPDATENTRIARLDEDDGSGQAQ